MSAPTLARLEALLTAFDAHTRCEMAGVERWTHKYNPARTESRLRAAAVDCGMSLDEPNVTEWAAVRTTLFLMAA